MNWEETIKYIRTKPEFNNLVEKAYFEEDLILNVERFKASVEFNETLKLLKKYNRTGIKILDIGCGNGISSIAFSLNDFEVTSVEPDPSETIGAGAIKKLINYYNLKNITVFESYAEDIGFENETFDFVYVRQAMHHAIDLNKFVNECARVLKKNGILLTIRDHVIFNEEDKTLFLETHPLHKFYGGENAYTESEYLSAMKNAGLNVLKTLKTFDSEINYFPLSKNNVMKSKLKKTIGKTIINLLPFFVSEKFKQDINDLLNEKAYPGRMYTFISIKL